MRFGEQKSYFLWKQKKQNGLTLLSQVNVAIKPDG